MFNLNLPQSAWPIFVNIYQLLLHLDKRYGATCSLDAEAEFFSYIRKIYDVLFIQLHSYLHQIFVTLSYLFLFIYFCTLLPSIY